MPKLDIAAIPVRKASSYPAPFAERAKDRIKQALGQAGDLTDFGVNLVTLPPGGWSSQRHWHSAEDELVYILSGELLLVTDAGEEVMLVRACAAFAKNDTNGHHFLNHSKADAIYLEVGTRAAGDVASYPDIDMVMDKKRGWYQHKDGRFYPMPGEVG